MVLDNNTVVQLAACLRESTRPIELREMLKTPHWDDRTLRVALDTLVLTGVVREWITGASIAYQWIR
jgi:hypothetical protein